MRYWGYYVFLWLGVASLLAPASPVSYVAGCLCLTGVYLSVKREIAEEEARERKDEVA